MHLIFRLTCWLIALLTATAPTFAQDRIALVIGNGMYASVPQLANPVSDAKLIAQTLEGLDFSVTLLTDASQVDLRRAISKFGSDLRSGGPETVGLFYYAGHGVQSFGANYLLPVDASLNNAADLDLVALEASAVLRQMASARNRTNIVILDACRNNPFEAIPSLDDNGLAEMKAPTGTYLAYATSPGGVALDGVQGNSPFTSALAVEMQSEGLSIEQVFKNVRVRVINETGGQQTPWDTSSLTGDVVFKAGVQLTAEEIGEEQLWRSVEASRDAVQIVLFMRSYPEGRFHTDARDLLSEVLQDELGNKPAAAPAVAAAPPQTAADLEADLIENARQTGKLEDYQAYLDAFPGGVYSELAKLEIGSLQAKAAKAGAAEPAAEAKPAEAAEELIPEGTQVLFSEPLLTGAPEIVGQSIEDLVNGTPLFAPIEGIPEEVWKGHTCASCHQWTREALCTQATTYLTATAERSLAKQHPLGPTFKQNLKRWAEGGCE
ncbi:MAG: caspase family protein [Paracoccaceae bacterium]